MCADGSFRPLELPRIINWHRAADVPSQDACVQHRTVAEPAPTVAVGSVSAIECSSSGYQDHSRVRVHAQLGSRCKCTLCTGGPCTDKCPQARRDRLETNSARERTATRDSWSLFRSSTSPSPSRSASPPVRGSPSRYHTPCSRLPSPSSRRTPAPVYAEVRDASPSNGQPVTGPSTSVSPALESGTAITPQKEARPFRAGSFPRGCTIWYKSSAQYNLATPPCIEDALAEGCLYVHTNTLSGDRQVWIFTADGTWGIARKMLPHPSMEDRVLWLRVDGEPSWITRHTYRTYQSRARLDDARKSL